ncbi:MAG: EI24 domain-containing protein [Chitinophagaceae bacterium]
MLKEIVIAIQSYAEAHRFITNNKLWKWIIIPGIIYTILFIISMYFFGKSAVNVIEYLNHTTGLDSWIQKFRSGILGFLFAFANIALILTLMLFYFSLFKYIWLILCSPVFSYLSEKTQSILEGKEFTADRKQYITDISRGVKLAVRNALWQTVYSISLILLCLFPVAGWITPLIALFVECYYYGSSMMDYSCARQKLSFSESTEYISKHRGLAVGNGLVFYLMHAVIPLAPAYAIIAATLSLYKVGKE